MKKLIVHVEIEIGDGNRHDYSGVADFISGQLQTHYRDISVTVEDAIIASTDSEYSIRQD